MADVRIYTTQSCPYCVMVKRLLTKKGAHFDEVDVSFDPAQRDWLVQASGGRRTVPQVFIDGAPYGGYTDLAELDRQGKLDALLGLG